MLIKIIIIKMDTKNKKCMIKINIKMMTKIMIKMNGKIINYNMSNSTKILSNKWNNKCQGISVLFKVRHLRIKKICLFK